MQKKGNQSGKILYKGLGSNVKFKNKEYNFTMVSNTVIRDSNLSLKAKGLYSLIQSYITIPGYQLYKSYLYSICSEGERAFDSAWKELQDAGYFLMEKKRDENNRFFYVYELLDTPVKSKKSESEPPQQNVGMDKSPDRRFAGVEEAPLQNPLHDNGKTILKTEKENFENKTFTNNTFILSSGNDDTSEGMLREAICSNQIIEQFGYLTLKKFVDKQFGELSNYLENFPEMQHPIVESFSNIIKNLLIDLYLEDAPKFKIGNCVYYTEVVKNRLFELNCNYFRDILYQLVTKTENVTDISAYIKTMLLNAQYNQANFASILK